MSDQIRETRIDNSKATVIMTVGTVLEIASLEPSVVCGEEPLSVGEPKFGIDRVGNGFKVGAAPDVNGVVGLLDGDADAPGDDFEGIGGRPGREAEVDGDEVEPPPPPPPLPTSCANPTDIGFWRNTEYTFFKNVSPMTHVGPSDPTSLPMVRSNMDPTQSELPSSTGPRFMSSESIDHAWPPNDKVTCTEVEQGNWKNPWGAPWARTALDPGTAAQMATTSSVGPPMAVVPVSMADSAALPVATLTDFP